MPNFLPSKNKVTTTDLESLSAIEQHLFHFAEDVSDIELPAKFTFPFYYQPHRLTVIASKQLQQLLQRDFDEEKRDQGKMFGVLIVKDESNKLGFLAAISGHNQDVPANTELSNKLVPQVFKGFGQDSYFEIKQIEVNQTTQIIEQLESSPRLKTLQTLYASEQAASQFQITQWQKAMTTNRKTRKQKRSELDIALKTGEIDEQEAKQQSIQLSRESVADKKRLSELKGYWLSRVENVLTQLEVLTDEIAQLKKQRRKLSSKLQKMLFKEYKLLNANGEEKHLIELFKEQSNPTPPAGTGDCAAPKLMQFAYESKLTPVCMAEFWWGKPPKSEIRQHLNFYPACQGKCLPVLTHMLEGLAVDPNPLLENPGAEKGLKIIYQDKHLVVVNKPHGLLSVPGVNIQDSVYTRVKALFPNAEGNLILHRLDMATSGLLVLSLNKRAHKHLQNQFINKEIQKRYIAIIDGKLEQQEGTISLPLCVDVNDRPRQMVSFEHGKPATTKWQVIEYLACTCSDSKVEQNKETCSVKTKLYLYPITGRTHQLRMHCAHADGLHMPIIGDSLYGKENTRLFLHAQRLEFTHPISKEAMCFEVDSEF